MRIAANSFVAPNGFGINFRSPDVVPSEVRGGNSFSGSPASELVRLRSAVIHLKKAIDSFSGSGPLRSTPTTGSSGTQWRAFEVLSADPVMLDPLPATAATLTSTEQINTTPTSYSTRGPEFSGGTTSQATLSGIYDGSNGTDTLTFSIVAAGGLGVNKELEVRDGQGDLVDQFALPTFSQDISLEMSNGLTLDLSAGSFEVGDSFDVDVDDSIGESPRPQNPFDGIREQSPWLESGFEISDGQFEINGVSIAVSSDDSLDAVLQRIGESGAGVQAQFDAATERVVLTHQTLGAEPTIALGADTSGFLAAFKLNDAVAVGGTDEVPGQRRLLEDVEAFSTVRSGSFSVNASVVAVDIETDSLSQVIDRINFSDAGVQSGLNFASQFSIRSSDPLQALHLGSDSSGLLDALGIPEGTFEPIEQVVSRTQGVTPGRRTSRAFASQLRQLAEGLNRLYAGVDEGGFEGGYADRLRSTIGQAIASVADGESFRIGASLRLSLNSAGSQVMRVSDGSQLARSVRENADVFNAVFFGSEGLVNNLGEIASQAIAELEAVLSLPGGIVNQRA
ncbi:hypothetical protein [Planctomycetes bacterium TBK1r]|uniref:Flagellar hook-associated protein FlgL n=1 Tax=Stieleria magnilauensis TaxID=2527963 RepID=A0ABX5Y625_9BACT|nr:flagellar hook-associated protein FlgL [Planctomycetes bacterium TBK1r]